jgi:hypothetical protein
MNGLRRQSRRWAVKTTIIALLLASTTLAASSYKSYKPRYGVTVQIDKRTDFSAIRTYAWTTGWSAFEKSVDAQVVAAVDRELGALGLTQVDGESGDMLVTYGSLVRTDVDLKARATGEPPAHPGYAVGSLVVLLLEPQTRRELYRARADARIAPEPDVLDLQINSLVKRMFVKYPSRRVR